MDYRRMGRSGLKVSELCLGTLTFGHGVDEKQAKAIVDQALDAGINFFDTANQYNGGQSEIMLGKALQGRRRDAIVATKFEMPVGHRPNDSGMSRYHIMEAIEDSLRRLQMDHVDIYYVHHIDIETEMEEMLRAMDDLVHQGKVRYMGCSNYQAWRIAEALGISERLNLYRFEVYEPQYSLVVRDIEQEILPYCRLKGLGVCVWGPLAGGFLTGKYRPGERSLPGTRSEDRFGWPSLDFADNADDTLSVLLDVAQQLGRTPAQVALRWVLDQPGVTSAIVGARTPEQLRENVFATGWKLDSESMERLNKVSAIRIRYPDAFESRIIPRRLTFIDMPSLTKKE